MDNKEVKKFLGFKYFSMVIKKIFGEFFKVFIKE